MKKLEQLGISPAPWHVKKVVCDTNTNYPEEGKRDQLLIAAAPKLYEALYDMVEMYRDGGSYEYEKKVLQKAKSALAEAAGEKLKNNYENR